MIVDTSVVVAILLREPGHERLVDRLRPDIVVGIGAPTMVEAGIVMTARVGPLGTSLVDRLAREASFTVLSFTEQHWALAVHAFSRFGKGRHPAKLNFGDCLTYATASMARQPLLCVGNDFALTDLQLLP